MEHAAIIASIALAVLGAVAAFQHLLNSPIIAGDITAAFSHDVAGFVSSHKGNLPSDWAEFCHWMNSNGNGREVDLVHRWMEAFR